MTVQQKSRRPLNRESILEAARQQAAEFGLETLSIRNVAARLDVTPMALYRHVHNKDEILEALVDHLLAEIGVPDAVSDWHDWLDQLAQSLRSLFEEHPAALELFNRQPITTPAARRRLELTTEVLTRAGFGIEAAVSAYAAVHTYTIGFCGLDAGRRRTLRPNTPLDAPDDPTSVLIRGFVSEDRFFHGLHALIAGLAPDQVAE